jgi:hypothetical protein
VADCDETPGGCFVLFSDIVGGDEYRVLAAGQLVDLEFEHFPQDGSAYRAVSVRLLDRS